jgi:iron complex outermembrane receptor protein
MFKRTKLAAGVLLALGGTAATGVLAQDAPAQNLERVEITGSAIKRINAETAVPVTVVRAEELKKEGINSVEQVIAKLGLSVSTQTTSQTVGSGTGGASFADLRGIGADKTLVLLNGRRIANNAIDSSAVDLNMIPFSALDRVEVLRDGASALYGTDAIGGVINFITRRSYEGLEVTASTDIPQGGGGKTHSADLAFGKGSLEEDRYNVLAIASFSHSDRINSQQRAFGARGVIPERGVDNTSGTTFPANYTQQQGEEFLSSNPGCVPPRSVPTAGATCRYDPTFYQDLTPKTQTASFLGKGSIEFAPNHVGSLEYFITKNQVDTTIGPPPDTGLTMNPGTQFFPGAGITPAPTNFVIDPTLPISVNWRNEAGGPRQQQDKNTTQRLVAAFEGAVMGWDYSAAAGYNENKVTSALTGGYTNYGLVSAGVLDGTLNPFGPQDAIGEQYIADAAVRGIYQEAKGKVYSVDAKVSRELGDWFKAGTPSAVAFGAEFRKEKFYTDVNAELASAAPSLGVDPDSDVEGDRNVSAVYAELTVPVVKSLELGFAVRHDRYSDFGSTTNPKASFRFQPSDSFLMRGSYSTGFRAPSLYEIYQVPYLTFTGGSYDDPVLCPGGVPAPGRGVEGRDCNQQFLVQNGGNENLKPEESKNYTLGFVFEPMRNVTLGIDFWYIKIDNAIAPFPDNVIFGDPDTYADRYVRDADGTLSPDGANPGYVIALNDNLGGTKTRGVDLSATVRSKFEGLGALNFQFNGTYVDSYKYQREPNGPWLQNAGFFVDTGVIFRWQHSMTVTLSDGPWMVGLTNRFKSGYRDENIAVDEEFFGDVGSYTLWDVFGSFQTTEKATISVGVRNIFDRDPSFSNQSQTFQAGYDPRYSEVAGRTLYARVNYKFF